MPKIPEEKSSSQDEFPESLKPYKQHGLDIHYRKGVKDATTDCWHCGREGKIGIVVEKSTYRCNVCFETGNQFRFIRTLHEISKASEVDYTELCVNRKLHRPETLKHFGLVRGAYNKQWIVPGHNEKMVFNQLYQYVYSREHERMYLRPTPGCGGHSLFGMQHFDAKKPVSIICEGLWDTAMLYEVLSQARATEDGFEYTGDEASSMLADKNLLGFATNMAFKEAWTVLFANHIVILVAQNDHPHYNEASQKETPSASYMGMERIAKMLLKAKNPPSEIRMLYWHPETLFDPELKSGYDVRDFFSENGNSLGSRLEQLTKFNSKILSIPATWVVEASEEATKATSNSAKLKSKECSDYRTLLKSWVKAMRWRQSMDDVLSVMLAVAASTMQVGDQLFLQVVGQAGGGKTRFCDAMLVSDNCYKLEHITGFYSGWKGKEGEDYSILSQMNNKTCITPEGDVIMSSNSFNQIMSEQRRIFDGSGSAKFKHQKESNEYTGLRTPWIMAGTPAMMYREQAHLGDRFLKVCFDEPDDDEKREILRRSAFAAIRNVKLTSGNDAEKQMDPKYAEAYALTGGYVDYLRENAETLLGQLEVDEDRIADFCSYLGEFTADMRARRDPDADKKDIPATKELGTRLTQQFVRLACCLAVVMNKKNIDEEIQRRVRQVALDTSFGVTLGVAKLIRSREKEGISGIETLYAASILNKSEPVMRDILRFMRDIKVLTLREPPPIPGMKQKPRWYMTDRFREVYLQVMEADL